jgi:hypothetical protein
MLRLINERKSSQIIQLPVCTMTSYGADSGELANLVADHIIIFGLRLEVSGAALSLYLNRDNIVILVLQ